MVTTSSGFVPALKYHFLTSIYDRFLLFWLPEQIIREETLKYAEIKGKERVLDFGCGTASLLIKIQDHYPYTDLSGWDVDHKILAIAKSKTLGKNINLELLSPDLLESSQGTFDLVFATWVFHHFNDQEKEFYLNTCKKLLHPQGRMLIADWGKPANRLMKVMFFVVRCFDSFATMNTHSRGAFPLFFKKVGFSNSKEVARRNTWFGTLKYWVLTP